MLDLFSHYCFFIGFLHRFLFQPPSKWQPFPKSCFGHLLPVSTFTLLMREIYSLGVHDYLPGGFSIIYLSSLNPFSKLQSWVQHFPKKFRWIYSSTHHSAIQSPGDTWARLFWELSREVSTILGNKRRAREIRPEPRNLASLCSNDININRVKY